MQHKAQDVPRGSLSGLIKAYFNRSVLTKKADQNPILSSAYSLRILLSSLTSNDLAFTR